MKELQHEEQIADILSTTISADLESQWEQLDLM